MYRSLCSRGPWLLAGLILASVPSLAPAQRKGEPNYAILSADEALTFVKREKPGAELEAKVRAQLAIASDPDRADDTKQQALWDLRGLDCHAPWAAAQLKPLLRHKNYGMRANAALGLAILDCDEAVDDLIQLHQLEKNKTGAVLALQSFGPAAKRATAELEKYLLKDLGYGAMFEAPKLPKAAPGPLRPSVDRPYLFALLRINLADKEEQYRIMRKAVEISLMKGADVREVDPLLLLPLFPEKAAETVPLLSRLAMTKSFRGNNAIRALGGLGAAAEPALPTLRTLLSDNSYGKAAEAAITQIKAAPRPMREEPAADKPALAEKPSPPDAAAAKGGAPKLPIPAKEAWDFSEPAIKKLWEPVGYKFDAERRELTWTLRCIKNQTIFDAIYSRFTFTFYDAETENLVVVVSHVPRGGTTGDEVETTFELPSRQILEKTKKVVVRVR